LIEVAEPVAAADAHVLRDVLARSRWWMRRDPFPHFVASEVFEPGFYRQVEHAFRHVLARGLSESSDARRLSRAIRSYDVYALNLAPDLEWPLAIFVSRAWHDLLATLTGVAVTGDVNGGFHHHAIGSANGAPHNDLNPGWFADCRRPDGINLSRHDLCNYLHGTALDASVTPHRVIRAVAMIYYLCNEWVHGDGGETGLYRNALEGVAHPAATVPPVGNSMLVFECTPFSYHAFLSNHRRPRNSVILWLHRSVDAVTRRWGERSIVGWSR